MLYQNPLFLIPMLTGIVFLLAGLLMRRFPPKSINMLYGYRTPRSMKSKEAWDFAQRYGAQRLLYLGLALMAASTLGFIVQLPELWGVGVGLGLLLAGVIMTVMRIEKELKDRFN